MGFRRAEVGVGVLVCQRKRDEWEPGPDGPYQVAVPAGAKVICGLCRGLSNRSGFWIGFSAQSRRLCCRTIPCQTARTLTAIRKLAIFCPQSRLHSNHNQEVRREASQLVDWQPLIASGAPGRRLALDQKIRVEDSDIQGKSHDEPGLFFGQRRPSHPQRAPPAQRTYRHV